MKSPAILSSIFHFSQENSRNNYYRMNNINSMKSDTNSRNIDDFAQTKTLELVRIAICYHV